MQKLLFTPKFSVLAEKIWQLFSDVENYPRYIKYCQKAELIGPFAVGSRWIDRSTVAIIPMNVEHQIINLVPEREIVYKIETHFGGELWQKFYFESMGAQTLVKVEIEINFTNPIAKMLIEPIITSRNRGMIAETIKNVERELNGANS